jgi:hypothetical protein
VAAPSLSLEAPASELVATSDWSRPTGAYPYTQKPTKQEPLRLPISALVAGGESHSACDLRAAPHRAMRSRAQGG